MACSARSITPCLPGSTDLYDFSALHALNVVGEKYKKFDKQFHVKKLSATSLKVLLRAVVPLCVHAQQLLSTAANESGWSGPPLCLCCGRARGAGGGAAASAISHARSTGSLPPARRPAIPDCLGATHVFRLKLDLIQVAQVAIFAFSWSVKFQACRQSLWLRHSTRGLGKAWWALPSQHTLVTALAANSPVILLTVLVSGFWLYKQLQRPPQRIVSAFIAHSS